MGSTSCRSSTGPGSTRCRSAASPATRRCAASRRSATPGSTRASSRSRRSAGRTPESIPGGYGTGAAKGLTGADLPDNAYWEQWFPADWISESREQIRLWFYSISVMAMTMTGRLPYRAVLTYERVHDETGREMHKSTGNAIEANEAFEQMGADIVRWQFCAQNPSQNINFGYGPAEEVKRRLLTLWNSAGFLVTYANIAGWEPKWGIGALVASTRSTAGSSRARGSSWPRRRPPTTATRRRR